MLLMPIGTSIALTLLGLWLLKHRPRLGKGLIALSALYLATMSWPPIANNLLRPFENQYQAFDLQQEVDIIVVLGGCHATDSDMPAAAQLCSTSLYRLVEGLRILQANSEALLFLSGYEGTNSLSHAEVLYDIALSLGINPERIRTFTEPKDTEEEAQMMAPYLKDKRFVLISEASHLPRAMVFFQQQGLKPLPAPAVRLSSDEFGLRLEANALMKSERAVYEQLGQWWQHLKQ